jgi:succinyl-CoA synthetase beta subunit
MARLLEHQALGLLQRHGLAVPPFRVAATPAAACAAAAELGGHAVLKALIPVGRRGKAGAVKLVHGPEEAEAAAAALLGREILNFPVSELLVGAAVAIRQELFASISFDSMERRPIVLFSALGGIDVEEILDRSPEALIRQSFSISRGLRPFEAREIACRAGLSGDIMLRAADALSAMYRAFAATDAQTVEVNPLAVTEEGDVVAASGVVVLDDQALFRHPDLAAMAEAAPSNGWRPLSALERRMREIDATDPTSSIRFNEFAEGRIGFMVTGGGAGFLALDHLMRLGGDPATTFDITPGRVEDKMYLATTAVLGKPGLKGLLVGGNITNFIPIDVKVRGVMRALKEAAIDPGRFPVVFRFAGPGSEEGRRLAAEIPGIVYLDASGSIEEAVERIVELTRAA